MFGKKKGKDDCCGIVIEEVNESGELSAAEACCEEGANQAEAEACCDEAANKAEAEACCDGDRRAAVN